MAHDMPPTRRSARPRALDAAVLCTGLLCLTTVPGRANTRSVNLWGVAEPDSTEFRVDGFRVTPQPLSAGRLRINGIPPGRHWVEALGPREHRILSVRVAKQDESVPPPSAWHNVAGRGIRGTFCIAALFATGALWIFARTFKGFSLTGASLRILVNVVAWVVLLGLLLLSVYEWWVLGLMALAPPVSGSPWAATGGEPTVPLSFCVDDAGCPYDLYCVRSGVNGAESPPEFQGSVVSEKANHFRLPLPPGLYRFIARPSARAGAPPLAAELRIYKTGGADQAAWVINIDSIFQPDAAEAVDECRPWVLFFVAVLFVLLVVIVISAKKRGPGGIEIGELSTPGYAYGLLYLAVCISGLLHPGPNKTWWALAALPMAAYLGVFEYLRRKGRRGRG